MSDDFSDLLQIYKGNTGSDESVKKENRIDNISGDLNMQVAALGM